MRSMKQIPNILSVIGILLAVGSQSLAGNRCCECGTECKLKQVYRPVISFREVPATCYEYTTCCEEVPAATSTCCQAGCQGGKGGDARCSCPGKPTTICVPVAKVSKCCETTRCVPCVTWVVECVCETCCKKCRKHGLHHDH